MLDGSGFVRRSEVFSGAVNEDKTLASMLEALGAPSDALVVMDAGIATEANIAWLRENGYRYLAVNRRSGPGHHLLFGSRLGGRSGNAGRDRLDDSCLSAGRVLPCGMRRLARDRAQVLAGPGMLLAELLDFAFTDTGALYQQALEHLRLATEHRCLLHQCAVPVQGLAEGRAQRHRLALFAGPFAQLFPRRQHLDSLRRERVDGRAVTPAVDRVADFPRDAHDRVVVRRRVGLGCLSPPIYGSRPMPLRLPTIPPRAVRDVVERRFLGLRARPALRQIRPHVAVRDRHVGLVLGMPVGDVEGQRRPVDIDIDPLPVPGRGGIDGFARGPVVDQQEGPVDGQTLGRSDGHRVAVIEADVVLVVADLVVAERHPAPVVGAGRDPNRGHPGLGRLRAGFVPPLLRFVPFGRRLFPVPDLQVLDSDHGAVEELLVPLRGADPQTVADRDLERLRQAPVQVTAHLDDGAFGLGRLREHPLPHEPRECACLGAGAREHHRRGVRLRANMALPVVHQTGQRLLFVVAEMKPAPEPPRLDRLLRLPVP